MGRATKHCVCQTGLSRRLKFLTSGHSDAQSASNQSASMSKVTNDGLTRSGTHDAL